MGEAVNTNAQQQSPAPKKQSWFKGLKKEFKKIVWPDAASVWKQTAAVIVITILLGALIFGVDQGISVLLSLITN